MPLALGLAPGHTEAVSPAAVRASPGGFRFMRYSPAARALREAQSAAADARRAGSTSMRRPAPWPPTAESPGGTFFASPPARPSPRPFPRALPGCGPPPPRPGGIREWSLSARASRGWAAPSGCGGRTAWPARSMSTTQPGRAGAFTRSGDSSTTGNTRRNTASSSPVSTRPCGGWPSGWASSWTTSTPIRRTPAQTITGSGSAGGSAAGGTQPGVARVGVPAVSPRRLPPGALAHPV